MNTNTGARLNPAWIALAWVAAATLGCSSLQDGDPPATRVVIAISEPEYETATTLPALADKRWTAERGYAVTVVRGDPAQHSLPGLVDAARDADVLVLSIWRHALPKDQLQAVRDHLAAGKPVLAIRTSSHAFALRPNGKPEPPTSEGRAQWPEFDAQVLGGNYHGHYPNGKPSTANAASGAADHPILAGVDLPLPSNAGVYRNDPLKPTATPLLIARLDDGTEKPQPVAWTHYFGSARVFYTSLGNADDFKQPAFENLLDQAMRWLCEE